MKINLFENLNYLILNIKIYGLNLSQFNTSNCCCIADVNFVSIILVISFFHSSPIQPNILPAIELRGPRPLMSTLIFPNSITSIFWTLATHGVCV